MDFRKKHQLDTQKRRGRGQAGRENYEPAGTSPTRLQGLSRLSYLGQKSWCGASGGRLPEGLEAYRAFNSKSVERILDKELDEAPLLTPVPELSPILHPNIRGVGYFLTAQGGSHAD
ncbi:hypothetical protein DFAR_1040027 [Desulfarculales bacterium]